MAHALETRFREQTGLAVTIAVHIGMAAVVLIGFQTATAPPARPPLVTSQISDPPKARPVPLPQRTIEQKFPIDVSPPPIDITPVDQKIVTHTDQPPEPPVKGSDGTVLSDPQPQSHPLVTPGPTSTARLDPRYAADFQPLYPASEERAGVSGAVIVHVRIGTDGRVIAASVAHSSGSARLDQAAVTQALKKWRFVAALKDGAAVEAERDITVTFRLTASGW